MIFPWFNLPFGESTRILFIFVAPLELIQVYKGNWPPGTNLISHTSRTYWLTRMMNQSPAKIWGRWALGCRFIACLESWDHPRIEKEKYVKPPSRYWLSPSFRHFFGLFCPHGWYLFTATIAAKAGRITRSGGSSPWLSRLSWFGTPIPCL